MQVIFKQKKCHNRGISFFKEPVIVLEEEIRGFRKENQTILFPDSSCII